MCYIGSMKTIELPHLPHLLRRFDLFLTLTFAINFMIALRWPHGLECPQCGSDQVTFLRNARLWKCRTKHPRQKFSVKVGTIFKDRPIVAR